MTNDKQRRTRAKIDTVWVMFEQITGPTDLTKEIPRKAFLNQADGEAVVALADDLFADHNLVLRAIEVWKPK